MALLATARWQAERVKHAFVFSPVLSNLHVEIEEYARVEKGLELLARRRPDGLDHRAALADEDRLLRFALDQDRAIQAHQPLATGFERSRRTRLFELVDDNGRGEREFVVGLLEDLLANELGDEE